MTIWSDAEVETLRRFINQGLSARAIAAGIGNGRTKNGVISKAWALGIKLAGDGSTGGRVRSAAAVRAKARGERTVDDAPPRETSAFDASVFTLRATQTRPAMRDLDAGQCAWPYDDARGEPLLACGAACDPEASPLFARYCAVHGAIAKGGRRPDAEALVRSTERFLAYMATRTESRRHG